MLEEVTTSSLFPVTMLSQTSLPSALDLIVICRTVLGSFPWKFLPGYLRYERVVSRRLVEPSSRPKMYPVFICGRSQGFLGRGTEGQGDESREGNSRCGVLLRKGVVKSDRPSSP